MTQNEDLQKAKLRAVLDTVNRLLGLQSRWALIKWSVEGAVAQNITEENRNFNQSIKKKRNRHNTHTLAHILGK